MKSFCRVKTRPIYWKMTETAQQEMYKHNKQKYYYKTRLRNILLSKRVLQMIGF